MMKMTGNKRQHDSVETFVRENASMMAKHAEENPKAAKRYRTIYKCKDCEKVYNSFQALGGHRAAHKNISIIEGAGAAAGSESADDSSSPAGLQSNGQSSSFKLHHCKICGKGFPIGQALGGHMRMHWRKEDNPATTDDHADLMIGQEGVADSKAIVPYHHHPPPADSSSSSTVIIESSASNSKSKEVFEFDLNLTPCENESVNLGLQLQ